MNRRKFFKNMTIGGTILVVPNFGGFASNIPDTINISNRVFRGHDDHELLSILKSPNIKFDSCRFINCSLIHFRDQKTLSIMNCKFTNTPLKIDNGYFKIEDCMIIGNMIGYYFLDLSDYYDSKYPKNTMNSCYFQQKFAILKLLESSRNESGIHLNRGCS